MPREFADTFIYTIQPGDTLGAICETHGVPLELVLAANTGLIADASRIQAGWDIVIPGELTGSRRSPAPAGNGVSSYTVEAGDTLGALAQRWGTTVQEIADLNGITNPSLIFVGQRLRRPGADEGGTSATTIEDPVAVDEPVVIEPARTNLLEFVRWPLDMPPGVVTGGYRQDYGNYLHRGIDIGHVPVGTPIFAPAGGTVVVHRPGDGWGDGSFGINVVIDHPGTPWWSIYAHMNDTPLSTGQTVRAGDVIGEIGFTGFVVPPGPAGAHLHWQLSAHSGFPPGFEYIANPLDFLRVG